MKSKLFVLLLLGGIVPVCALRSETADSLRNGKTYPIGEVVVTGTRHETDVRHLPMTISVVGRQKIVEGFQPSLLPTLTEQIPGLFVTGRGIMGWPTGSKSCAAPLRCCTARTPWVASSIS